MSGENLWVGGEKTTQFDFVFNGGRDYTLGVELEFQLLDCNTLDLVSKANSILQNPAVNATKKVVSEMWQSIVEVKTAVCNSVYEVERDLYHSVKVLEDAAQKQNCILYSSALHPFTLKEKQELSQGERYQYTLEETQYVGNLYITQGVHVHVGVKDGDTAVRVCDIMQTYLPILLSMSASSPYFRGVDTGFHSYRTKLIEALPIAGIAGFIGDWQQYVNEIALLKNSGMIRYVKDLRWDIRPNSEFGTVEIRICDSLSKFSETLGLVAIIQAVVAFLSENNIKSFPISLQVMKGNKWQAARYGLSGQFIDGYGLLGGEFLLLREAAEKLLKLINPFIKKFQTEEYVMKIHDILRGGSDAERQRRLISEGKTHKEMITCLSDCYWK